YTMVLPVEGRHARTQKLGIRKVPFRTTLRPGFDPRTSSRTNKMSSPASTVFDPYVLATGASAARRLHALHKICAPAGLRLLRKAGFPAGARVADFGCGVGATTR